jgi:hypothetical protein
MIVSLGITWTINYIDFPSQLELGVSGGRLFVQRPSRSSRIVEALIGIRTLDG